jgi:hypothetical protein
MALIIMRKMVRISSNLAFVSTLGPRRQKAATVTCYQVYAMTPNEVSLLTADLACRTLTGLKRADAALISRRRTLPYGHLDDSRRQTFRERSDGAFDDP